MDQFPKDFDGLFSADGFDLATIGFGMEEDAAVDDDTPRINPLHDPDSLDFYLWMEEEVDNEARRREAKASEK